MSFIICLGNPIAALGGTTASPVLYDMLSHNWAQKNKDYSTKTMIDPRRITKKEWWEANKSQLKLKGKGKINAEFKKFQQETQIRFIESLAIVTRDGFVNNCLLGKDSLAIPSDYMIEPETQGK